MMDILIPNIQTSKHVANLPTQNLPGMGILICSKWKNKQQMVEISNLQICSKLTEISHISYNLCSKCWRLGILGNMQQMSRICSKWVRFGCRSPECKGIPCVFLSRNQQYIIVWDRLGCPFGSLFFFLLNSANPGRNLQICSKLLVNLQIWSKFLICRKLTNMQQI